MAEHFEIKPCELWEGEKLEVLKKYASEVLGITREINTFTHKLILKMKRTPKMQFLLDTIREIGERARRPMIEEIADMEASELLKDTLFEGREYLK